MLAAITTAGVERELVPFLGLHDPVSALTHALAALGMLVGIGLLLRGPLPEGRLRYGPLVYALACGIQLTCSTLYHAQGPGPGRELFWHLDHATIWISLAGAATSTMATFGPWRPRYVLFLWALAGTGAGMELVSLTDLAPWISPLLYVCMGWAGFPLWLEAARRHGPTGWPGWLLLGGSLATIGGLIDAFEHPNPLPGLVEAHEVMHALILTGGWCWLAGLIGGARTRAWDLESQLAAPLVLQPATSGRRDLER